MKQEMTLSLIRAALRNQTDEVRRLANIEACAAEDKRASAYSRQIRRMLAEERPTGKLIPLPQRSDSAVEWTACEGHLSDVWLAESVRDSIDEVCDEWRYGEALQRRGIPVGSRLLLAGPSGCGKTMLAGRLAAELGIPLGVVQLAKLIDSHLGATGHNLHAVFSAAAAQSCVLLLDEIDTIAASRTKSSSSGEAEANRIVNTCLQLMDRIPPTVLVVGATNRIEDVDRAILRRFDRLLQIPAPTFEELRSFEAAVAARFPGVAIDLESTEYARSYAEAEQNVLQAVRRQAIEQIKADQQATATREHVLRGGV